MKKILLFLTMVMLLLPISSGFAASFYDVSPSAPYYSAVNNLSTLGIMNGVSSGVFSPDTLVTREQFARIVVGVAGLDKESLGFKSVSNFSDVSDTRWSSPYINLAVSKGYIKGMLDGNFHPIESITFAQACTIFVRVLGYSDSDITGVWPQNYIEKALSLDITKDMSFTSGQSLPRWAVAIMANRTLSTDIKGTAGTSKPLSEASELFSQSIILENSKTMKKLTDGQVLTNKGIYFTKKGTSLNLGYSYGLNLKDDVIEQALITNNEVKKITAISAIDNKILYNDNGSTKSMYLPDKTEYYYHGIKQTYDAIKTVISLNSSIVLYSNDAKTGYDYGVIYDPIYSEPVVAKQINSSTRKIGNIKISNDEKIIRNNVPVNLKDIIENDVAYEVSDIWGKNKYVSVIDNKVDGVVTNVQPSKNNPRTITIDTTDYQISPSIDLSKISLFSNLLKENNHITALLGNDDKIVDIYDNNDCFAFILNTGSEISTDANTLGSRIYTVKLLTEYGVSVTYKTHKDYSIYKGNLIQYTAEDDSYASLKNVSYAYYGDINIDKDKSKIGSNYAGDSIKIFNVLSNYSSEDMQIEQLTINDLPNGLIPSKKLRFMHSSDAFGDIDFLVLDDILNNNVKLGFAKEITATRLSSRGLTQTYSLVFGGKAYSYSTDTSEKEPETLSIGNIYKLNFYNNTIEKGVTLVEPSITANTITAISHSRIKINSQVYALNDNVEVYIKEKQYSTSYTEMGIDNVKANFNYSNISVYLDDKDKVQLIIITA